MHAALALRRRGPELEAERAVVELRAEILDRARTDVLQAVLDALGQVGDEAVHRAFVLDGARDALRHLLRSNAHCDSTTELGPLMVLVEPKYLSSEPFFMASMEPMPL
mmetsp:Transcript_14716/g.47312  ORF Transcript_14716/g.47312 Transcript_14716/m.47312 type:complete len:108 (-) Transcript_14716:532-855(-)